MNTEKYLSSPELSSVLSKPEKDSIQESRLASPIWASDTCDSFLLQLRRALRTGFIADGTISIFQFLNFSEQVLYCTSNRVHRENMPLEKIK